MWKRAAAGRAPAVRLPRCPRQVRPRRVGRHDGARRPEEPPRHDGDHRSLPRDEGVALVHTIANNSSLRHGTPFIEKYIFPNAVAPSIAQIGSAIEGLFVIEDLHNIGPDYDPTLMAWWENFDRTYKELPPLRPRFYQMWKFYLLAAAGASRRATASSTRSCSRRPAGRSPTCRAELSYATASRTMAVSAGETAGRTASARNRPSRERLGVGHGDVTTPCRAHQALRDRGRARQARVRDLREQVVLDLVVEPDEEEREGAAARGCAWSRAGAPVVVLAEHDGQADVRGGEDSASTCRRGPERAVQRDRDRPQTASGTPSHSRVVDDDHETSSSHGAVRCPGVDEVEDRRAAHPERHQDRHRPEQRLLEVALEAALARRRPLVVARATTRTGTA